MHLLMHCEMCFFRQITTQRFTLHSVILSHIKTLIEANYEIVAKAGLGHTDKHSHHQPLRPPPAGKASEMSCLIGHDGPGQMDQGFKTVSHPLLDEFLPPEPQSPLIIVQKIQT